MPPPSSVPHIVVFLHLFAHAISILLHSYWFTLNSAFMTQHGPASSGSLSWIFRVGSSANPLYLVILISIWSSLIFLLLKKKISWCCFPTAHFFPLEQNALNDLDNMWFLIPLCPFSPESFTSDFSLTLHPQFLSRSSVAFRLLFPLVSSWFLSYLICQYHRCNWPPPSSWKASFTVTSRAHLFLGTGHVLNFFWLVFIFCPVNPNFRLPQDSIFVGCLFVCLFV